MSFFGGPKGGGSSPPPVIPAPAPVRDDATVLGASLEERRRIAAQRGRASTILGNADAYLPGTDNKPSLTGMA